MFSLTFANRKLARDKPLQEQTDVIVKLQKLVIEAEKIAISAGRKKPPIEI